MPRTSPSWSAGCYFWVPIDRWGAWRQLPMVECNAHTTIKGSSTRTRLTQYFTNVNDSDIAKCQYAFPLYDGVSVVGFKCQIGGKILEGIVKERGEAKQEFDEAVAKGESAGLMEQNLQAADVFSTSLGNLPKGSTAVVVVEYVGELGHDLETDALKFEMPTGIAPRYGGPGGYVQNSVIYPCAVENLPPAKGFEWTCDIELPHPITKVESPSHAVSVTLGQLSHEGDNDDPDFKKCSAKMTLQKESGLSKELILTVKSKGIKEPVALWETHPKIPDQTALMTTLVPNFALPQIKPEIVFVCDRSGSMSGEPIQTLVDALRVMLHSLPANGIKFNICSFGSGHSFLFKESKSYSRETLKQAVDHLGTFGADFGGTETESAVRATIDRRFGDIPLEIILLTDGDIWNQGNLFTYLNEKVAESKQQIRVFPLGIGHGVSTALIEGVARAGNGFPSTVMPGERMDQRCMRMLKAALSPHVTDYTLEVQYEREEEDDFEIVESVRQANELALRTKPAEPASGENEGDNRRSSLRSSTKAKTISLFDSGVDADDTQMADINANIPDLKHPKILQAPFSIPPLYAFKRTTVYLLLGPECAQRTPKSVILKGTLDGIELKLEIPILNTGRGKTVHQLAARRAVQDMEEGRGWPFSAKTDDGKLVSDKHPSSFDDLVKSEAVRIGTTFQVMNKWCSYIARERKVVKSELKMRKEGSGRADDEPTGPTKKVAANSDSDTEIEDGQTQPSKQLRNNLTDAVAASAHDAALDANITAAYDTGLASTAAEIDYSDDDMGYALFDADDVDPFDSMPAAAPAAAAAAAQPQPQKRGARTKQTARKSTGGKAPRKQLASKAARKAVGDFDFDASDDDVDDGDFVTPDLDPKAVGDLPQNFGDHPGYQQQLLLLERQNRKSLEMSEPDQRLGEQMHQASYGVQSQGFGNEMRPAQAQMMGGPTGGGPFSMHQRSMVSPSARALHRNVGPPSQPQSRPMLAGSFGGIIERHSYSSGGLFGTAAPAAVPQTQMSSSGGGLFGLPGQQTPGGLFGGATPAVVPQGQMSHSGGSLFGSAPQPVPQSSGRLFGNATPASHHRGENEAIAFGSASRASPPPPERRMRNTDSFFKDDNVPPAPQAGGIFGGFGTSSPPTRSDSTSIFASQGSNVFGNNSGAPFTNPFALASSSSPNPFCNTSPQGLFEFPSTQAQQQAPQSGQSSDEVVDQDYQAPQYQPRIPPDASTMEFPYASEGPLDVSNFEGATHAALDFSIGFGSATHGAEPFFNPTVAASASTASQMPDPNPDSLDFANVECGDVLDQFNFDAFVEDGGSTYAFNFDMGGFGPDAGEFSGVTGSSPEGQDLFSPAQPQYSLTAPLTEHNANTKSSQAPSSGGVTTLGRGHGGSSAPGRGGRRGGGSLGSSRGNNPMGGGVFRHRKVYPDNHPGLDEDEDEDNNEDEAMPDAPTPAPLPSFANDAARVRAVIGLQEFDGSFDVLGDEEKVRLLAHVLGIEEESVRKGADADPDGVTWVTVLVLVWLEEKMAGEGEVWEMSAEKARSWLDGAGGQDAEGRWRDGARKVLN